MVGQRFMENMIDLDKKGNCSLATFCEEKRAAYQSKLIRLFEIVQEENKAVHELMLEANQELQQYRNKRLTYQSFKEDMFTGIETIIPKQ